MKKFSPSFWIFIVLILLFLGVVIYHYWISSSCLMNEGFISFQENASPLDQLLIPTYSSSKPVYKLYDNVFFDITNGNLIQANGVEYSQNGNGETVASVDNSGTSITSVVIKKRDGSINPIVIDTQIVNGVVTNTDNLESRKTDYNVKFSHWLSSVMSPNQTHERNKYQVLYVAWEELTFLDVIDYSNRNTPLSKLMVLFDRDNRLAYTNRVVGDTTSLSVTPTSDYLPDSNDGKMVQQSVYGQKQVYQICSFLQYDTVNGLLIFVGRDGQNKHIEVHDRNNNVLTEWSQPPTISSLSYSCFIIPFDAINANNAQYIVYFMVYRKKTLVVVLQTINNSADLFKIVKVARFDEKGYVKPDDRVVSPHADTSNGNVGDDYGDNSNAIKTLFNNDRIIAKAFDANMQQLYSNDVLLADGIDYIADNYAKKTELVPPVYPVVLSCPSAAGITDSSGNRPGSGGGSGDGESKAGVGETVQGVTSSVVGGVEKVAGGAFDLAKTAAGGAVDITKSAAGGAVDVARETAGGAVGLARETAGGAVGIARETVGGAVDLTKSAAGGTVDLLKSAGSGAVNELNYLTTIPKGANGTAGTGAYGTPYGPAAGGLPIGGPTSQYPMQYNNKGAVQGVDPYSRYGAMPNKGGDYLPLTASFSAFGK